MVHVNYVNSKDDKDRIALLHPDNIEAGKPTYQSSPTSIRADTHNWTMQVVVACAHTSGPSYFHALNHTYNKCIF